MLWMPRSREWSNSIEILPVLKQHTELWDQCPEPQKRNARSWTEHQSSTSGNMIYKSPSMRQCCIRKETQHRTQTRLLRCWHFCWCWQNWHLLCTSTSLIAGICKFGRCRIDVVVLYSSAWLECYRKGWIFWRANFMVVSRHLEWVCGAVAICSSSLGCHWCMMLRIDFLIFAMVN